MEVGQRIRVLRKQERVTLIELAKRSGVDQATISRIETGKMTGTLESHLQIAKALGSTISELYEGIEEGQQVQVAVQTAESEPEVYVHESGHANFKLLTADVLKKRMMPVLITIDPRGSTTEEEGPRGAERFVYCLNGEIEAHVGEQRYQLKEGNTLYLDASLSHQFKNTGTSAARCISIITPPVL